MRIKDKIYLLFRGINIILLILILLSLVAGIAIVIHTKNSVKDFTSRDQSSCDECNKDEKEECEIKYKRQPYTEGMAQCKTDNDCIRLRGSTGTYKCETIKVNNNSKNNYYKSSYNSCSQLNGVRCTQGTIHEKGGSYFLGGILIAI